MDSVGTFEMAVSLAARKIMTAVHKHYSVEDWYVLCRVVSSVGFSFLRKGARFCWNGMMIHLIAIYSYLHL